LEAGTFESRVKIALLFFLFTSALTLSEISVPIAPTGDEPYYLLTTHSLVVDGDISIGENHKNHDYRIFYPGNLLGRATVGADGVRVVPAHGMGLSLFLVPFYYLALHFFPGFLVPFLRVILCAVTSLCVYLLLGLGESLGLEKRLRYLVIAGVCLCSPFLFYSNLFYPEIFAFLLIAITLSEFRKMSSRPIWSLLVLGLVPALLLWFHPKYLLLAIGIMLISSYEFVHQHREKSSSQKLLLPVIYLAIAIAGILGFFLFLHFEYGSWSPDIIYAGDRKATSILEVLGEQGIHRLAVMGRMVLGFWLDQRFGILPYAPLYAGAVAGIFWVVKKRKKEIYPAIILFALHFLVLSWSSPLGGFAPPSRHFVVMLPFLALFIWTVASEWSPYQRRLFLVLELVSWVIALLMLTHYRLIFANVTWRNSDELSPFWSWLHLENWIPQLTTQQINSGIVLLWLAIIAILSYFLYPRTFQSK
jgi:hypothetical protein